ncbi:MAG: CoB--CoM heterodisulfide reductase iron-sulfur subunit B family protein [Terriglobia bacterium]|jgi:heterodisulfide reductase subunit B
MNLAYYPGCALHGSSNDYEQSLRACLETLDVQLKEIDDWICCGATAAHSLNQKLAVALPARNLALAEGKGFREMLAPCPMCSMQLLKARKALAEDEALRRSVSEIVELEVRGDTQVLNLIQLFETIGLDRLKAAVKAPLGSICAACYYGCLLTRPASVVEFDDCEQPRSMEKILEALGGKTVDWNYRTECCGAGMTMANEQTVLDLSHKILSNAAAHGANCLVVACPMCHVNLDMKQVNIERRYGVRHAMPIYYLSDVVGLALGFKPEALGINRHFVGKA